MNAIEVYSVGLVHLSACVSKELTCEEIVARVNKTHPTGLDHGWALSGEENFAGGEPNPCPCNTHPDERLHYLLVC